MTARRSQRRANAAPLAAHDDSSSTVSEEGVEPLSTVDSGQEPERSIPSSGAPAPSATGVKGRLVVAPRRSVTSFRGILDSGTEVTARDFGGEGSLAELVKAGIVVEAP